MYITNSFETIYLYSFCDKSWITSFDTEEQLINFLIVHYAEMFGEQSELNLTWNDTVVYHNSYTGETQTHIRNYVFVDSHNRVVDVRLYKPQVDEKLAELPDETVANTRFFWKSVWRNQLYESWKMWHPRKRVNYDDLEYGETLYNPHGQFRFRCDPVPGLGHHHCKFGVWFRFPHTTQELRMQQDEESKPYIRARRKQIPTSYDDVRRGWQRSWKQQSKKRKQWM